MTGYLTHLRSRLRAVLGDPASLAVLLGTGALTWVLWPGPMPPSGPDMLPHPDTREQGIAVLMFVFWLFLWPALAAVAATGRAVATGQMEGLFHPAHPPLPVGARARALAEATVVMLFVLAARAPIPLLGERVHDLWGWSGPYPGDAAFARELAVRTLLGMVTMAPALVAWVCPARSVNVVFGRVAAVVGLEVVAMWAGLLSTPLRHTLTCLALASLPLLPVGREWQLPLALRLRGATRTPLSRPPRSPHAQLVRDFWLRPVPLALTFLAVQAAVVAADHLLLSDLHLLGDDGPGVLYFGSTVVLSLALGWVVLRPMGSAQVVAGVFGKTGYRPGDFVAAYSVLPVRRESVLRGVYLHGVVSCLALWLVILSTVAVWNRLRTGAFALVDADGDPVGHLLLPAVAVIPCIAGMLAAGAAGRRGLALLAGACMIGVLHGHMVLLVLDAPAAVHGAVLSGLALLGGVPSIGELLPPRSPLRDVRGESHGGAGPAPG